MKSTQRLLQKILNRSELSDEEKRLMIQDVFKEEANLPLFGSFFFPEAITNTIPKFHMELYTELCKPENTADAAPRGHAKSTCTGLVYLSWSICNKREQYIVYVSQNHAKTVQFLNPIRHEFMNNALLKWVYGPFTIGKTHDEHGKNTEDTIDINNIRLEAVSFEKNLRGFKYKHIRPTLIICDDIEDDQRVLNPELRIKDENKLNKVIIPSLDVNGRLKFIGTILHPESLLSKKIKQYKGKLWEACDADFNNVLWPERYSATKLKQIALDIGSIPFQCEYRNNPLDTTKSIIRREWVQACFRPDISMEELRERTNYDYKALGVDFAFEDRITSNYSTFASVGIKDGYFHLFNVEWEKGWSAHEQLLHIKNNLHARDKYISIAVEENSIKSISKDLKQYDLPLVLFWMGSADEAAKKPTVKEYEYMFKRHTIGKLNLVFRLATSFENKRWIIPYKTAKDQEIAHKILSECTSWALADGKLIEGGIHPDMPISMGLIVETNIRRPVLVM